jgi:ABC-type lipoprotein release transport system permease subunit
MIAGFALGAFGVKIQFPAILGWNLRLYFPAAFAAGAAVLTLILCLLASIMPSVRAAWLPVPAALRNE